MALRDISNTYIPSVRLSSRYAPVIKRGVVLDDQSSRASFPTRRANGETHIDLWIDGGLYPMDPATNSPPCFSTTKEYLEFLCHSEQGMLGYTKRLSSAATRLQSMVRGYEEDIHYLQQQYEVHRGAVESFSNTTTELVQERICTNEVEAAAAPLQETRLKLEAALKKMRAEDDEASVALNAAYMVASKETRRLLREGAPAAEYVLKVAEMEDLASQIASEREADATIVAEVLQLESIAAT